MQPALPSPTKKPCAARFIKQGSGAFWVTATAAVLLTTSIYSHNATAQSAKSPKTSAPSPTAAKATATEAAKEAEPIDIPTPSRLVGPGELNAYVASLSSIFSMKSRDNDPFGQAQDSDAKPIIKTVATANRRVPQLQATPFSDIVRMIVVTTIMPKEKRFLVGTRSIGQGDRFPLTFRGKLIHIEVTEVSSREIAFRDLDSGETATRELDMLPAGMTPGNRGITARGMVPDRPDAPLELDVGESFTENTLNR
jgi:hypothetical protein